MYLASYRSPKTEFRDSLIEGKGRFAKEPLVKGEIVAIRAGHIVESNQLELFTDFVRGAEHQIADDFYLVPLNEEEFDLVMCYFNHSCSPNLGMQGDVTIVAMRDIEPGEELCLDYAMIFNHMNKFECKCSSKECRTIVSGKDWMRKDLQKKYQGYFSSYLLPKMR